MIGLVSLMQGSRFRLEKRTFGNQYAQIYFFRLQRLKPYMHRKGGKAVAECHR